MRWVINLKNSITAVPLFLSDPKYSMYKPRIFFKEIKVKENSSFIFRSYFQTKILKIGKHFQASEKFKSSIINWSWLVKQNVPQFSWFIPQYLDLFLIKVDFFFIFLSWSWTLQTYSLFFIVNFSLLLF